MAAHPSPRRLASIDALRGLAVLAVLAFHLQAPGPERRWQFLPTDLGHVGVTLFLVLSGFCIHLNCAKRMARGEPARIDWFTFWKRRFWRLYPPYVIAIAFSLAPYYLAYAAKLALGKSAVPPWSDSPAPLGDLIAHLLLIQNLFPAFWEGLRNSAFWTLALEEQLYAFYAAYLFARRRGYALKIALAAFAIALAWRYAGQLYRDETLGSGPYALGNWYAWPFAHWFAWVLGARAAERYALGKLVTHSDNTLALLAFTALGIATHHAILCPLLGLGPAQLHPPQPAWLHAVTCTSDLWFALASYALMCRWIAAESAGTRWPSWLIGAGTISYSLYLIHLPVIYLFDGQVKLASAWLDLAVRYALLAPACLAIAWAFYHLVEKRFLPAKGAA